MDFGRAVMLNIELTFAEAVRQSIGVEIQAR